MTRRRGEGGAPGVVVPRRVVPPLVALLLLPGASSGQASDSVQGLRLDDVLRSALVRSASVALDEQSVDVQDGALREATAAFDPTLVASVSTARTTTPPVAGEGAARTRHDLAYDARMDWRMRFGPVISPGVSVSRVDLVSESAGPRNTAVASLDVTIPVLRGWEGGIFRAGERAAADRYGASRADLRHARASAVLDAAEAYWGYRAATLVVRALRESEERAVQLLRQTETLVAAGERPPVDTVPAAANVVSKRAARLGAEQAVTDARVALALAMGLPAGRAWSLPPAVDDFPTPPSGAWARGLDSALVGAAVDRRGDLAAARLRLEAASELTAAARDESRPRLDLDLSVAATGIQAGDAFGQLFSTLYSEPRGLEVRAGLSYRFPLGNRAASGRLQQSVAAENSAAIAAAELARAVELDVAASARTLRRSVEEVRLSRRAVRMHGTVVKAEVRKYRLGAFSTLFDVIQAQDVLTGATLGLIDARRRNAVALARLRFRTGTLVGGPEGRGIRTQGLLTWEPHGRDRSP